MNPLIVPGLKVRILSSEENFSNEMLVYVGRIFTVKHTVPYCNDKTGVIFAEADNDSNLDLWHWVYEQGHFEILDEKALPLTRKSLKRKLNLKLEH